MAANSRQEQNRLYLNDGVGVFTDVTGTHLPVANRASVDLHFEDLDVDGDPDMFITNVGEFVAGHGFLGEPNVMLFNNGQGVFTDETFPRYAQRNDPSLEVEFADFDGDGVRDFVLANAGAIEQPNLPNPDGAEQLFLRKNCDSDPIFCLQQMISGLQLDVDALDTAPFPDGDMTSSDQLEDGLPSPTDWVFREAAERIASQAYFGLRVLLLGFEA